MNTNTLYEIYTINKQTPGEDLFLLAPPREGRRAVAI